MPGRPLTPDERRRVWINALILLGKIALVILAFPIFFVAALIRASEK